jgi:outer membrane protein assembly factor BamB/pSer/pThr/pTyr-binding forkhead associated (FHA) protein
MAELELLRADGSKQRMRLERRSPLTIGTRESNDIRVEGAEVQPIHCRISWNKTAWRVSAVTLHGVEVNGKLEEVIELVTGDLVRVGNLRLVFMDSREETTNTRREPTAAPGSVKLPPIPGRDNAPGDNATIEEREPDAYGLAGSIPSPRDENPELKPVTSEAIPLAGIANDRGAQKRRDQADAKMAEYRKAEARREAEAPPSPPSAAYPTTRSGPLPGDLLEESVEEERVADEVLASPWVRDRPAGVKPASRARRPGEEEWWRSPWVVGLAVLSVLLAVTSVTLFVWNARTLLERELEAAKGAYETGQYALAVERWEAFLLKHPVASEVPMVRSYLARGRAEQFLSGGSPDWKRGLAALDKLVTEFKNEEEFQNPQGELRTFLVKAAGNVAIGAAQAVVRARRPEDLEFAHAGERLLDLWSPTDSPPTELLNTVKANLLAARNALAEQKEVDALLARIDAALGASGLNAALDGWRELARRFPASANIRTVQARLTKIHDLARALCQINEDSLAAVKPTPPAPVASLFLGRRTRLRSDEASQNSGVMAWGGDTLFRLDSVSGDVTWRRSLGPNPPFFPVVVPGNPLGWLAWSSRDASLVKLSAATGETLWAQPAESAPIGAPALEEGQFLVAYTDGRLTKYDAETGERLAEARFGQPLSTGPVLSSSGDHVFQPGDRGLVHILTRRPLALVGTFWLGHAAGGVVAEPVAVRDYLALGEIVGPGAGRLRLLKFDATKSSLREIAREEVAGEIRQRPVLRGKHLFVPVFPEGIGVFVLSETDDESALTDGGRYRPDKPHEGPVSILPGPDEQVWMTGSAVRRLVMGARTLEAAKPELPLGLSAQPLQFENDSIYAGKRYPFSRAVQVRRIERAQMLDQYSVTVGAKALATAVAADGTVTVVNDLGELFRVAPSRIGQGGNELQGVTPLALPEGLDTPLLATRLGNDRIAVAAGGPNPALWIVKADNGGAEKIPVPSALSAPPVEIEAGLVLPLAGKLLVVSPTGEKRGDEWLAPLGDSPPEAWTSVIRGDDNQIIAARADGMLGRWEWRTDPTPHLALVTHRDDLVVPRSKIARVGDQLAILDREERVVLIDARTLDTAASLATPEPDCVGPYALGNQLAIATREGKLVVLGQGDGLVVKWETGVEGPLAGPPLLDNSAVVVASVSGVVCRYDATTGMRLSRVDMGRMLAFGPEQVGQVLCVGGSDGGLMGVDVK